jgi:hypothetical protein
MIEYNFFVCLLFFKTELWYVVQAGLKVVIFQELGLQASIPDQAE